MACLETWLENPIENSFSWPRNLYPSLPSKPLYFFPGWKMKRKWDFHCSTLLYTSLSYNDPVYIGKAGRKSRFLDEAFKSMYLPRLQICLHTSNRIISHSYNIHYNFPFFPTWKLCLSVSIVVRFWFFFAPVRLQFCISIYTACVYQLAERKL